MKSCSVSDGLVIFKALGSPVRVQILRLIQEKEGLNIKQIAQSLKIPVTTLSPHLNLLAEAGLIEFRDESLTHGTQKRCYFIKDWDQLLVNMALSGPDLQTYSAEIGVGHFSDFSVTPTCGMATSSSFVGQLDQPRYFIHPGSRQARIVWFTTGYLEYILHEVTAPDGYELADDIRFAYDRDGKLYLVTEENGTKIYTEKKDLKLTVYDMPKFCVQKVDAEGDALEGAVLEITTQEDDGFTPIRFTTTKDKYYPQGLKADVTYVLSEITPPQGYSVADPVSFVLKADGSVCIDGVTATDGRQVTMVDKAVTVYVAKKDLSTKKSLKGAKLAIKNEAGETLYSFVSEKEKTTIPGSIFAVPTDQNYAYYSLCELEAPEGYGLAESVDFAINRSGQLYLVETDGADKKYTELTDHVLTMYDMAQLSVSKKTENGKYLKGATLKITAEKDTSFEAITIKTDGKPAYFDSSRFTAGTTYVVSETKAPKGYSYATDVKFKLDQDGNVYVNGKKSKDKSIIMTDEKIQVKVAKKDENSHKHLENAELAVKDADGKVLYTFTSMSKEVTLPAKIFTAPQDEKYTYYTLTEVKAPEGYELAKDIRFAIDKNGTLYIRNAKGNYKKAKNGLLIMYDSPTFTSSTSITTTGSGNKVPKTGDQTPLGLLLALCGLSLAGMISAFSTLLRRRRRVNRIEKR